jgi:hypothetical protein
MINFTKFETKSKKQIVDLSIPSSRIFLQTIKRLSKSKNRVIKWCAHSIVLNVPELVHVDCSKREGAHIPQCCAHSSKCAGMNVMYIYVCIYFEAKDPM